MGNRLPQRRPKLERASHPLTHEPGPAPIPLGGRAATCSELAER
jgi:hypothetical protein